MRSSWVLGCMFAMGFGVGCGGSERPAEAPPGGEPSELPAAAFDEPQSGEAAESAAETKAPESAKPAVSTPTPEFKENGSVAEAINAVPQGTPRLNIEQEALGQPLGKVELYEPCKPGNLHFKAKVAVWDGKAVGLDLTTTPKNQKFATCIAERIRSITWPDKVKSLNIVEYTF